MSNDVQHTQSQQQENESEEEDESEEENESEEDIRHTQEEDIRHTQSQERENESEEEDDSEEAIQPTQSQEGMPPSETDDEAEGGDEAPLVDEEMQDPPEPEEDIRHTQSDVGDNESDDEAPMPEADNAFPVVDNDMPVDAEEESESEESEEEEESVDEQVDDPNYEHSQDISDSDSDNDDDNDDDGSGSEFEDGIEDYDDSDDDTKNMIKKAYRRINIGRGTAELGIMDKSAPYGEMTATSMQTLFDLLLTKDKSFSVTKESTFLDIGSGNGKVVIHAMLQLPVFQSVGVEIDKKRCKLALQSLDALRGTDTFIRLRDPWCTMINEDVTTWEVFHYSHVYMYDLVFTEETLSAIAILLNLKASETTVLISYKTKEDWKKAGLTTNFTQAETCDMVTTGNDDDTQVAYIYTYNGPAKPASHQNWRVAARSDDKYELVDSQNNTHKFGNTAPDGNFRPGDSQRSLSRDATLKFAKHQGFAGFGPSNKFDFPHNIGNGYTVYHAGKDRFELRKDGNRADFEETNGTGYKDTTENQSILRSFAALDRYLSRFAD